MGGAGMTGVEPGAGRDEAGSPAAWAGSHAASMMQDNAIKQRTQLRAITPAL